MKFSIRFADQIVGILVILALAILVFVVFMLGKNQRWFVKDSEYKTYFTSASGISKNMPVQHKGFTIGRVKDVKLSEDDSVIIFFTIFEEYSKRVKEGSVVEVQESPIGLGSSFVFYFGRGTEVIPEGNVIPEVNSPEAKPYMARGLTDIPRTSDRIGNIVNQVNSILETINHALIGADGENTVRQIVGNVEGVTRELNEQLKPLITNLESFTAQISNPKGPLNEALTSLAGIIENLNKTSEFIPAQLPQVAVAINELNIVLRQIQGVLTSIANNPLLRNGIPEQNETGPTGASPRDQKF
jgi:phospholipid/cholesterol/gamma-HCH transport system substrate-binding protein